VLSAFAICAFVFCLSLLLVGNVALLGTSLLITRGAGADPASTAISNRGICILQLTSCPHEGCPSPGIKHLGNFLRCPAVSKTSVSLNTKPLALYPHRPCKCPSFFCSA